jgi:hypothetical protein
MAPVVLVVVDVDGVVSPVHGTTRWADDVTAGHVFGDVHVSPTLVGHLDALAAVPGVSCLWLSDWTADMRAAMDPFPGGGWPALHRDDAPSGARGWWKLTALEGWLAGARDAGRRAGGETAVGSVVWLDDDLRSGSRAAACRRRLGALGLEVLLVVPRTNLGVTPEEMSVVGEWVSARVAKRDRHLLEEPWRASAVAPCGCAWDGFHCPHCSRVTAHSGDAWSPVHTRACHAAAAAHAAARGCRRRPGLGARGGDDGGGVESSGVGGPS